MFLFSAKIRITHKTHTKGETTIISYKTISSTRKQLARLDIPFLHTPDRPSQQIGVEKGSKIGGNEASSGEEKIRGL